MTTEIMAHELYHWKAYENLTQIKVTYSSYVQHDMAILYGPYNLKGIIHDISFLL